MAQGHHEPNTSRCTEIIGTMKTSFVINDELDREQAEAEARFYRRLRQRLALDQNHPDYPEEPDDDEGAT